MIIIRKKRLGAGAEEDLGEEVFLSVISNSSLAKIPVSSIEVIEQDGRKLCIMTAEREYECYDKIDNLACLLDNRNFYRPMKSLIINFARVLQISDGEITMESGTELLIGRNNYSSTKAAFKKYLLHYPMLEAEILHVNVAETSAIEGQKEPGKDDKK